MYFRMWQTHAIAKGPRHNNEDREFLQVNFVFTGGTGGFVIIVASDDYVDIIMIIGFFCG